MTQSNDYASYNAFDEAMEIEKIVDVVHSQTKKQYRVEVIKHCYGTSSVHYSVNYYEKSNEQNSWVFYLNFPWIKSDNAEYALHQALSYIAARPQLGESA